MEDSFFQDHHSEPSFPLQIPGLCTGLYRKNLSNSRSIFANLSVFRLTGEWSAPSWVEGEKTKLKPIKLCIKIHYKNHSIKIWHFADTLFVYVWKVWLWNIGIWFKLHYVALLHTKDWQSGLQMPTVLTVLTSSLTVSLILTLTLQDLPFNYSWIPSLRIKL